MKVLTPSQMVPRVQDIDFFRLRRAGIEGLLIDLDNTLVNWDRTEMEPTIVQWLARAQKAGFKVCFVSNARKSRVQKFSQELNIPGIGRAVKPRRSPFKQALRLLQLPAEKTAVIGDQLFTDVLGGNRMGMYTILLHPLSKNELRGTSLTRRLERRVLRHLARKGVVSPAQVRERLQEAGDKL